MDLMYGTTSYVRDRGNFPEIPVINMFAEETPIEPKVALISRPGLEDAGVTLGIGPVRGLFSTDGVLSNGLFAVSDDDFYANGVSVGFIGGSGPVSMAAFENRIFINAGLDIYHYDGTTLSTVTFPDSTAVSNICVGASRLIGIRADTGRIYWSDVLSTTIDALSFATAENSPDKLKACLYLTDTLILFGTETVEFWPNSSANPDLPFQPLVGRTYQIGCRDTDCATLYNGTFAWITNRNQVCATDPSNVLSHPGLEERIENSSIARLWTFRLESMEFLAVTLDTETWVFCSRSSQWSKFESYGEDNWIPRCFAAGTFGSSVDGRLVQWSTDYSDFDGVLERRFRAGAPITNGTTPLHNVILRTNQGRTPFQAGDYSTPVVSMRTSRDGGFKWGDWREKSLGKLGKFRDRVIWRSLGFFGYPALLAEFRVTDPVPFRVSDLQMNVGYENK